MSSQEPENINEAAFGALRIPELEVSPQASPELAVDSAIPVEPAPVESAPERDPEAQIAEILGFNRHLEALRAQTLAKDAKEAA